MFNFKNYRRKTMAKFIEIEGIYIEVEANESDMMHISDSNSNEIRNKDLG